MAREQNHRHHDDQPTCRSRRHDPGKAPLLAPGLGICTSCRDHAEETLIELPSLFEMCAHVLDLRPNGMRERVSGHRPRGIVLRDGVVSVRSEILGVLAAWCGLVTTERGVTSPDELAIRKLVGFLAIHLHWLFQHPAAPDFVDELTDLTNAATEAMRPDTGFRVAVGSCMHPGCGRIVYAEAHREGGEPYEVSCEAGHVWAPEHWLALGGRQNGGAGPTTGHTNGNGSPNGNGNGNANGSSNGHTNGNGHPNGHANGRANGNGHVNGNGHANGHNTNGSNGHHENGHTNGNGLNGRSNGGVWNGNGHRNGFRSPTAEGAE